MRSIAQLSLLIVILFSNKLNSQNFDLLFKTGFSYGFEQRELGVGSSTIFDYSLGDAIGLELGARYEILDEFYVLSTFGYRYSFAYSAIWGGSSDSESSYDFSYWVGTIGVQKFINIKNGKWPDLFAGAGLSYNLPGTLRRTSDSFYLGRVDYESTIGFYAELGARIPIRETWYVEGSLRYRNLNFSAESFNGGPTTNLQPDFQEISIDGLELGVTFVKRWGK